MENLDPKTEKLLRHLRGEIDLSRQEDDLLAGLQDYREQMDNTPVSESRKNRVWQSISDTAFKESNKSAPVHQLAQKRNQKSNPIPFFFAAAAAILIVGIGFWMMSKPSSNLEVYVSDAKQLRIELQDGSIVELRPYSKLEQVVTSNNRVTYQLEGEAFFDVSHNPKRVFSVVAGSGKVEVLGTRFDLKNWGNEPEVFLQEGSIRFSNTQNNQAIEMFAGTAARIDLEGNVENLGKVDQALYLDWKQGVLYFDNQQIDRVIAEFEQHFGIQIITKDLSKNTHISGSIELTNANQALQYLGLIINGRFEQQSEEMYLFTPNN